MNKDKEIHGVDISKDVFDVVDTIGKHIQYANSLHGFYMTNVIVYLL